jgi:excisionase family DNA binding protein
MQQPLLTSDEVAKILRVSCSYAYLMMNRGELPVVHVGNALRVRPEDLERYIHNNATQGDLAIQSIGTRSLSWKLTPYARLRRAGVLIQRATWFRGLDRQMDRGQCYRQSIANCQETEERLSRRCQRNP